MSSILFYSTRKSKFFRKNYIFKKMDRVARRGPATASPWRAKRGTRPKLSTFLSQLKRGPFGEKTNFRKKSHNAEKLKGGTLRDFKHPICCKISKKLKRGPFGEKKILGKKISQCRKTERGTLWGFSTSILSQNIKKLKGGKNFIFGKKSQCRKNCKGGPFGIFQHPF